MLIVMQSSLRFYCRAATVNSEVTLGVRRVRSPTPFVFEHVSTVAKEE